MKNEKVKKIKNTVKGCKMSISGNHNFIGRPGSYPKCAYCEMVNDKIND